MKYLTPATALSVLPILFSSCTTVVEKPAPTTTTEVKTRHVEATPMYPTAAPAVSTTTETHSLRAE